MLKEYRKFLISKFGKEAKTVAQDQNESNDEQMDDKWGRASDFTKLNSSTRPSSGAGVKTKQRSSSRKRNLLNRTFS